MKKDDLTAKIDIPEVNPVKEKIVRKITFNHATLRNLSTMAAHYHFDKQVKPDELLSTMIDDLINYYYDNKFIQELKK